MQKEVEYYGDSLEKVGDVRKQIKRWLISDPDAIVDLDDSIRILSENSIQRCLLDIKRFGKVKGYRIDLYELKIHGHNNEFRLLFIEKCTSTIVVIHILHAYVEKNKKHLKNEFQKAIQRAKCI